MAQMRLDKLLTALNCGSRREAGAWVRSGRVTIDETICRDPAQKVDPEQVTLCLDGEPQYYLAQQYYMLNKPKGYITATRDANKQTVLELFPEKLRKGLFPVGRLDKDTEGLLLITNDGAFDHALMAPGRHVSKWYVAEVEGTLAADATERFSAGLCLRDGTVCQPARLVLQDWPPQKPGNQMVSVMLQEGKYHQVKRMIAAVGGFVVSLRRVQIGSLKLDETLAPGAYRALSAQEKEELLAEQSK